MFLLLQLLALQKNDISPHLGTALAHRTQTLEQKWDTAEVCLPSFCLLTAGHSTTKLPLMLQRCRLVHLVQEEGSAKSEILTASPVSQP